MQLLVNICRYYSYSFCKEIYLPLRFQGNTELNEYRSYFQCQIKPDIISEYFRIAASLVLIPGFSFHVNVSQKKEGEFIMGHFLYLVLSVTPLPAVSIV